MNNKIRMALVCLSGIHLGFAAQEADPKIVRAVAQRKAAEQEVAQSEIFKNLIDRLNRKYDQEAEQHVRANMAELQALGVKLQDAGMSEEQIIAQQNALNNQHRQADKAFLAAQKAEKQSEIQKLVKKNWPAYAQYALDFKNY